MGIIVIKLLGDLSCPLCSPRMHTSSRAGVFPGSHPHARWTHSVPVTVVNCCHPALSQGEARGRETTTHSPQDGEAQVGRAVPNVLGPRTLVGVGDDLVAVSIPPATVKLTCVGRGEWYVGCDFKINWVIKCTLCRGICIY